MKKILSITLSLAALIITGSCTHEEDDIFSESAAERLNAASALYSARLMAQPNGWAMQLYPTDEDEAPYGNGYLMLLRFSDDYSVVAAMNNSLTGDVYAEDESAWEVITDDGPVLTFNTHNDVIHIFSDPDDVSTTDDDETGTGIGGDYEFIIVDAPEDASYMMLKGKKRATYNLLTPVEEGVEYESYLEDVKNFQNKMFSTDAPNYDIIHFGDSVYIMEDANDGIPNIYPYGEDAVLNESFNPFLMTKRGDDYYLRFRDEFEKGDVVVQEFVYLPDEDIFRGVDDETAYICGQDPLAFLDSVFTAGTTLTFSKSTSDMSSSFQTIYNSLSSDFKSLSMTLSNITFTTYQSNYVITISYKSGSRTSTTRYVVSYSKDDEGITFQYTSADTAALNVLNAVPTMQTLLDTISQKFIVSPGTTGFDLNTLKLTSASNDDMWFIVSI